MPANPFYSPLRYPGGKRKIAPYLRHFFEVNGLCDGDYAEPFAGGASTALALLYGEYAGRIYLNDLDPVVFAFWHSVLHECEALCRLVYDVPLTLEEWHRQRGLLQHPDTDLLSRGFAAFYQNRTNRAGILRGGVMGGQEQEGEGALSDRFNRRELVRRLQKVARYSCRIHLSNLDALDFLAQVVPRLDERRLVYLDPPYYVKGPGLYAHAYGPAQHLALARALAQLPGPWLLSYDNAPPIRALYPQCRALTYSLSYSVQAGAAPPVGEVLLFGPGLRPLAGELGLGQHRTMHAPGHSPAPTPGHQWQMSL